MGLGRTLGGGAVALHQEGLSVGRIDPQRAAQALAGCEALDPRGLCDRAGLLGMCEAGQCFELAGSAAQAVYVVSVRNGVCWVDALMGTGKTDMVALVDELLTRQADGLRAIGLQTARPGLVRKLQRHGYRVTGWVMRKDLQ